MSTTLARWSRACISKGGDVTDPTTPSARSHRLRILQALDDAVDLRTLIPKANHVHHPIRYGQSRWAFTGYPFVNQSTDFLDFTEVPQAWQPAVKDWILMRLNPTLARTGLSGLDIDHTMADVAAAERAIGVPSAIAYLFGLTASLKTLEQIGVQQLRPEHWHEFAARLRGTYPETAARSLAGYARPLISLWRYRGVLRLPEDLFGGRPFNGWTAEKLFAVADRRLNAERPASEVAGPLLGLALWMLDHCAQDILLRLEALAAIPDRTHLPRADQTAHVAQLLLQYEKTGRPLPATRRPGRTELTPAWSVFVKLAGCSSALLPDPMGQASRELKRLHDLRGVSLTEDGFDLPIQKVHPPNGVPIPWIDALPPIRLYLGLNHWSAALAYACTLIITLLTTVRDRELAALPHDCIRVGTYDRGDEQVPVTRMHGYLVKNRDRATPASWVVADDVVRAVEVLHRLKAALRLPPKTHPLTGKEMLLHPALGRTRDGRLPQDTLNLRRGWHIWLKKSGEHLADRGLVPPLPALPKYLTHRALRITGIEAYASRAWGDALAAAQAHWSSRTVAEGYFGHLPNSVYMADPEAVAEVVDRDRAVALMDVASSLRDDPAAIAGNGAARLRQRLSDSGAADLTGAVTQRQLNVLARNTKDVFVGELTICVHGPGGLCGNEKEADWLLCRPFACRNSGTTRAQRARLELRRRGWARRSGVFERARRKIEEDAPGLADEFADLNDADLRTLILDDLPGRYASAAKGDDDDDDQ